MYSVPPRPWSIRASASGSYFPLAVGNTWIYKYNDRIVTASYVVETISGQQYVAGQFYYVLTQTSPGPATTLALLRADSSGVIYQYTTPTANRFTWTPSPPAPPHTQEL